jgi:hypothetical protein
MNYVNLELPCGSISNPVSNKLLNDIRGQIESAPDGSIIVQSESVNNYGKDVGVRLDLNIQSGKCMGCTADDYWDCRSNFIHNLLYSVSKLR